MATCADCVHVEVCSEYVEGLAAVRGLKLGDVEGISAILQCDDCEHFKDRSRFVELPCMVGDTLYTIVTGSRIREWIVTDIALSSYSIVKMVITADSKDKNGTDHIRFGEHYLNHTVFLNREEAERALKEREA